MTHDILLYIAWFRCQLKLFEDKRVGQLDETDNRGVGQYTLEIWDIQFLPTRMELEKNTGDGGGRRGAVVRDISQSQVTATVSSNAHSRSQVHEDFPLRGLDEVQDG